MLDAVVQASSVTKTYGIGNSAVHALRGISLNFEPAKFTAIMGPSGSGKSTLLHCLAGLDFVTSGTIHIGDEELTGMSDRGLTRLRRSTLGFIFQSFNLLPTLTARENIVLPLQIAGSEIDTEMFDRVVTQLGLQERLHHRPSELSGGQQQRVAVARALVSKPKVVFADEPTGNLDSNSRTELLEFLRTAVDGWSQTIIMVTHDPQAAAYADRVVFVRDGIFVHEVDAPTAVDILDAMKKLEM